MTGSQAGFERRVQSALEASPSRIPVVVGGCGTGRTFLLQRLRERAARGTAQYVDVERCATTPEPFYAVGLWYRDFSQTTDEEVRDLLKQAAQQQHAGTS